MIKSYQGDALSHKYAAFLMLHGRTVHHKYLCFRSGGRSKDKTNHKYIKIILWGINHKDHRNTFYEKKSFTIKDFSHFIFSEIIQVTVVDTFLNIN